MKPSSKNGVLAFVALSISLIPTLSSAQSCPRIDRQLEKAVPKEIGSKELMDILLNPTIEQQLSKNFDANVAMNVFDDSLEEQGAACRADVNRQETTHYCNPTKSKMKVSLSRGKITYLNPSRSFKADESQENKIEIKDAESLALDKLVALGVPKSELRGFVDSRVLMAAQRGTSRQSDATKRRAELHVRVGRRIGEYPVFDSESKMAIDSFGNVARTHIRWPDFRIAEGLRNEKIRSRRAVVRNAARKLRGYDQCNEYAKVKAYIAYLPSAAVNYADGDETSDDVENASQSAFVPGIVIYATPREPKEDSGEIAMPGQQIAVPLMTTNRNSVDQG